MQENLSFLSIIEFFNNIIIVLSNFIISINPLAIEVIALFNILTFLNTRQLWQQSNRPIVSALVETYTSGNTSILYNLVIINSGNRPATNVKLNINNENEFKKCFTQKIDDLDNGVVRGIKRCFSEEGFIPLLLNGEKKTNSFGITSKIKDDNLWIYKSSFFVTIRYNDLEGKQYKSLINLQIKDSNAFAGSSWSDD